MISPTEHQAAAVRAAAHWFRTSIEPSFTFAGYAGTGKSTLLPLIIDDMGLTADQCFFVAPTGKAAKVMNQKLSESNFSASAQTIHSLIYQPLSDLEDQIADKIRAIQSGPLSDGAKKAKIAALEDELADAMTNSVLRFVRRPHSALPPHKRLIVCDEASMVNEEVVEDILSLELPVLAIGDPGQLPPVAGRCGFSLDNPDALLTEIHRQARDNPIIRIATMIRNGEDVPRGDFGQARVISRRDDDVTFDIDRPVMVLCGTHKKRWNLTKKIRLASGYDETGPCKGEPMLVCRNSRLFPELVNGTQGICQTEHGNLTKGIAEFPMTLEVEDREKPYELKVVQGLFEEHMYRRQAAYSASPSAAHSANKNCHHVDFGYVLTAHKSQGSQWPEVVIHDESGVFRSSAKEWLYTAVTRASERLTIVR